MRSRSILVLLLLGAAVAACARGRRPAPALPPLGAEGEVSVFLLPPTREVERLRFAVEGLVLLRPDGGEVPLEVAQRELEGPALRDQRLLAAGRVPPGDYTGLSVRFGDASLGDGSDRARLLVEPGPSAAALAFRVDAGRAVVIWARLRADEAVRADYGFTPALAAFLAPQTPAQVGLYVTRPAAASVAVADRRTRLVTGAVPVAGEPRGLALEPLGARGYVALGRQDAIEVLDLASSTSVGRIRLSPGDGPGELAFALDGVLLVVNERSRTVAFVDPQRMAEVGRVPVGDRPGALLLDRGGRRAYVANRGSATVTVIDVANRAVVGTLGTDPEPLRLALSRDGDRLHVVHRGSVSLGQFQLPALTPLPPALVGLGAAEVVVDARTDLVYLSRADEPVITTYDPVSLQALERLEVPGPVTRMAIDDAEDTLLALIPSRGAVVLLDLTTRRLVAEIPVGSAPWAFAFTGGRP